MGIRAKVNQLKSQFSTSHVSCEKCSYGRVLTGTPIEVGRMKKEWEREHLKHNTKTILEKLAEIPAIILDKIISAIHKEIAKR